MAPPSFKPDQLKIAPPPAWLSNPDPVDFVNIFKDAELQQIYERRNEVEEEQRQVQELLQEKFSEVDPATASQQDINDIYNNVLGEAGRFEDRFKLQQQQLKAQAAAEKQQRTAQDQRSKKIEDIAKTWGAPVAQQAAQLERPMSIVDELISQGQAPPEKRKQKEVKTITMENPRTGGRQENVPEGSRLKFDLIRKGYLDEREYEKYWDKQAKGEEKAGEFPNLNLNLNQPSQSQVKSNADPRVTQFNNTLNDMINRARTRKLQQQGQ